MVPSALTPHLNTSHAPTLVRLHVIACAPFSDDTYLPMLCRATLPFPSSTTKNCSHVPAVARVQVMAVVPFSPLTYLPLNPLSVMVCPTGAPEPLDCVPFHLNVAAAPAGKVYVKDSPPHLILKVWLDDEVLRATTTLEPSVFLNATSCTVVENVFDDMRTAPAYTNSEACATV